MKKIAFIHSRSGFTLIELLVGMTIFSIAITSIFLLLESTMKSVRISRNEVIVSNLLREQLELVRNVRDANLAKGAAWNVARIDDGAETNFSSGTFLIENDFSTNVTKFGNDSTGNFSILESPVKIKKANFSSDEIEKKFQESQLCFDDYKRYIRCDGDTHRTQSGTTFASYTNIFPMYFGSGATGTTTIADENDNPQGFILDARVIVRDGNVYREYDAKTAITDWQR